MNGKEVVATTGDPAFAVDREGKIIAWNDAAEYCLGYRRSEVVGRRCCRVLQGRDLSSNRYCSETCAVREMATHGEPIHRTQMFYARGTHGHRSRAKRGLEGREGIEPPTIRLKENSVSTDYNCRQQATADTASICETRRC